MEKKKGIDTLLAVMGIMILFELIAVVISVSHRTILTSFCKIVSLIFIALYGFRLYKKPHGNMLKYAMLLLSANEIICAAQCIESGYSTLYLNIAWLFVAAALAYVAGRLNRIEQNKYLLTFAVFVQLLRTVVDAFSSTGMTTPLYMFTWFSGAISILTLMIAYFVRYQEHREAGLMDAPTKK